MGKIVVRRADGEVIKIDENEALGELRKIRDTEKRNRKKPSRRPKGKRPSNNNGPKRPNNNRDPRREDPVKMTKRPKGKRKKPHKPWKKRIKKIAVFLLVF